MVESTLRTVLGNMSTLPKNNILILDEVLGRVAKENYDNMKNLYEKIPNNLKRNEIIKDILLQYFRICFDVNLFETEYEKLQYLEKIKTTNEPSLSTIF